MSESRSHKRLVQSLVSWVQHECPPDSTRIILVDSNGTPRSARPPSIAGYVPDVYVHPVNLHALVVGEAKTSVDLATPRSSDQLAAFLRWCSLHEDSRLLIAVPWDLVPLAKNTIARLKRDTHTGAVTTIVLEKLRG